MLRNVTVILVTDRQTDRQTDRGVEESETKKRRKEEKEKERSREGGRERRGNETLPPLAPCLSAIPPHRMPMPRGGRVRAGQGLQI